MKPAKRTKARTRAADPLGAQLLALFVQFEADTIAAYQKSLFGIYRRETDPIRAENRKRLVKAVQLAFTKEVRDV